MIAQANGLNSPSELRVGQVLNVPAKVGTIHNTAQTYKTYDPSKIQGDNYTNDVTGLGTGVQLGLGVTGFDLPMDIRDLTHDFTHWETSWGHVGKTLLDGVGLVPLVGVIKNSDEIASLFRSGSSQALSRADNVDSLTDAAVAANSGSNVSLSQIRALRDMGVSKEGRRAFFNGENVQFQYPTVGGDDVYGFLQFQDGRLTSQLFSIHNTAGGAPAAFKQFVSGSQSVGRSLGLSEIELQGGSVINPDLAKALASRGFQPKTVPVPDALGGGTQDVLFKTVPVKPR